jgi:hypothetical protein
MQTATISQLKARKQHYKLRMFQKLQYILLFVVFVIAIFFVVSTLTFTGRLAEGSFRHSVTIWHLILHFYRLRGKKLESALVAPGRLAISPVLLRVWGYRLPVAAIGQQQQMSCFRCLSYVSDPD